MGDDIVMKIRFVMCVHVSCCALMLNNTKVNVVFHQLSIHLFVTYHENTYHIPSA